MNNETLTFLSASEYGSYQTTARVWGHSAPWTQPGFLQTDFAGMNSNVYEALSSSSNTLGYPSGTGLVAGVPAYRNDTFVTHVTGDYLYLGASTIFNSLILHRQGPYGWPTWKQIRGAGHPLARYWRKNNVIPITVGPYYGAMPEWKKDPLTTPLNTAKYSSPNITIQYTEPPITSRFMPLKHGFVVTQDQQTANLNLKHSYGNLISHYSNAKLNLAMGGISYLGPGFQPIYDDLKAIYIEKKFQDGLTNPENPYGYQVPYKKWINFIYSETVFPKETNAYLSKTRRRVNYAEEAGFGPNGYDRISHREFWKNGTIYNGIDRTFNPGFLSAYPRNLRTSATALNSQGYTTVGIQSVWDLDTSISGATTNEGHRPYLGELQSVMIMSSSCRLGQSSQWGMYLLTASICAHRAPIWQTTASQVHDQLYRGIPVYMTDQVSGKAPFFNSYEDFAEDIRGMGKSYSILPEFRISDHMDYYINTKGGNFRALNNNFISIDGASIPSSSLGSATGALNQNFFVDYSHTDFLKYFEFFKHDHQLIQSSASAYTLTAKGIMKLLPYNGFYPPQRVKQLGTLFSQSFGGDTRISGTFYGTSGDTRPDTHKAKQTAGLNTLLRPFLSPGIAFNSLKSAIAVDYPVTTGSSLNVYAYMSTPYQQPVTSFWLTGKDYRLPFEAVIEPHEYLPVAPLPLGSTGLFGDTNKGIQWDEPDGVDATEHFFTNVYWTGERDPHYSLAANNFFGEIPRFFLKNEKFTEFVSAQQSEWKIGDPKTTYYMDVILKKTPDMVLCEGQYEPGETPYTGSDNRRGIIYGPPHSTSWLGPDYNDDTYQTQIKDPVYAAYTPPYFYEDSTARIAYTPTSSGQPSIDDLLGAIGTVIGSPTTATAQNSFGGSAISGTFFTGSSAFLGLADAASKNKMKITASVNLGGKSRYKEVEYSTDLGPDGKFIPVGIKDTATKAFEAWNISSKFECPALNFSRSLRPELYNATTGRGIWGGYADIEHGLPTGSTGLFLEIRESYPQAGKRGAGAVGATTGSLIDLCGFKPRKKRIGKIADSKQISEAIIAIPYTRTGFLNWDNDGSIDSNFAAVHQMPGIYTDQFVFSVNPTVYKTTKKAQEIGKMNSNLYSTSVGHMLNKMRKFNIPPMFDFLNYPSIDPFVMYIFEFTHELSRQDLMDIWQGLMPEISRTAKMSTSTITHLNDKKEFFHGKELPNYTRWMVFKVKQKAEKSYFNVTSDQKDDNRFAFKFKNSEEPLVPTYNYNWPYDFFSLVELAEIDAGIEFKPPTPPSTSTTTVEAFPFTPEPVPVAFEFVPTPIDE